MSNEILWIIFLLVDFSLALLAIYLFGPSALYVIIAVDIIVCNIQVVKTIELFEFASTLGNILYGSIFLATDLLSEIYGKKEARRGVWLGFFAMVFVILSMQFALLFKPHPGDFAHPALQTIFGFISRIALASLVAYLISQHHDVWAYHFWKKRTAGKYLWLRNNASTWVSQAIDTMVFIYVAFYGVFKNSVLVSLFLTTYFTKVLIAALDTPIIYIGRRVLQNHQKRFRESVVPQSSGLREELP